MIKNVSKQGPVYIRVTTEVHDESFKRWYGKDFKGDEEADSSSGSDDDESLMVSPFALKSECECQVTEPPKKKMIVSEDQNEVSATPTTSGCLSQSGFGTHSKSKRESQVMVGYNTYVNMFPDDDMSCEVVFFGLLVKSLHLCSTHPTRL